MSRRKNVDWSLPDGEVSYDGAMLAVLMDIRDELKTLNRVLACPNFLDIPNRLSRIVENTTRVKRRRRRRVRA